VSGRSDPAFVSGCKAGVAVGVVIDGPNPHDLSEQGRIHFLLAARRSHEDRARNQ